jgi:hypothetical protein
MLALANVASAATPSGADQYLSATPNAGGTTGEDTNGNGGDSGSQNDSTSGDFANDVGGTDGVATTEDVKKQAEKNKAKQDQSGSDDSGSTGTVGAVTPGGGGGGQPPSATSSAATAAKFGPFSRNTALAMIGVCLVVGLGGYLMNTRAPGGSMRSGTHGGDASAS